MQVNVNIRESFTLKCAHAKISHTAGQCALLNTYRKIITYSSVVVHLLKWGTMNDKG